jgi:hypothetical protein
MFNCYVILLNKEWLKYKITLRRILQLNLVA